MGLAIVFLLILLVMAIVAIPILARVFGEATRRNSNRPEGEGDETSSGKDPDKPSGPGRE